MPAVRNSLCGARDGRCRTTPTGTPWISAAYTFACKAGWQAELISRPIGHFDIFQDSHSSDARARQRAHFKECPFD